MELFERTIFTGKFERPECRVQEIGRTDDWNLLLLRSEALPTNHLPCDALPGRVEDWAAFAQFPLRLSASDQES